MGLRWLRRLGGGCVDCSFLLPFKNNKKVGRLVLGLDFCFFLLKHNQKKKLKQPVSFFAGLARVEISVYSPPTSA